MTSIQKLGFQPTERVVIINADDFGVTQSTNQAIMHMFSTHAITSTSLMLPADAAQDAALLGSRAQSLSVGIHITMTSHKSRPYKPIAPPHKVPSLTNRQGYFYELASDLEQNADPAEVKLEVEAQILKAISLGIDPTHVDSHAGSVLGLYQQRDFLEVIFELCVKYALPFCFPIRVLEHPSFSSHQKHIFNQRIDLAHQLGIGLINDLAGLDYHYSSEKGYDGAKQELINQINNLKPGITQITTHPAYLSNELKELTTYDENREMEVRLYNDPEIKAQFKQQNIKFISWKAIRDLQRNGLT
ncbi:ChbG/HpnK family deacetylase [Paenibacillus sp. MBLB2552]|uniref:ChbG/HpnK family deacetylase n=1 Tax=Paenibacillus mellifer TaxID=2937794 RepID=A0A9X2BP18_9BACL|nr:ChbG/HpnK family deacetylase [Paenibacillus mellifer]MCK8486722.1 ChbG/HpnK family deacetylase [Paenibacillus mellifer]